MPILTTDIRDKLITILVKVNNDFDECTDITRISFLNYSFVLDKLFKLMDHTEFCNYLIVFKSLDFFSLKYQINYKIY